jgi:hypothetical protein
METFDIARKVISSRQEVNRLGRRVDFWVDWNLRVIRNDPHYVEILNEVKNNRLKAFNIYLKMINENESTQETLELDPNNIIEIK